MVDGQRQWCEFDDIELHSDDFSCLGEAYAMASNRLQTGKLGAADSMLMPKRELVDFVIGSSFFPSKPPRAPFAFAVASALAYCWG